MQALPFCSGECRVTLAFLFNDSFCIKRKGGYAGELGFFNTKKSVLFLFFLSLFNSTRCFLVYPSVMFSWWSFLHILFTVEDGILKNGKNAFGSSCVIESFKPPRKKFSGSQHSPFVGTRMASTMEAKTSLKSKWCNLTFLLFNKKSLSIHFI